MALAIAVEADDAPSTPRRVWTPAERRCRAWLRRESPTTATVTDGFWPFPTLSRPGGSTWDGPLVAAGEPDRAYNPIVIEVLMHQVLEVVPTLFYRDTGLWVRRENGRPPGWVGRLDHWLRQHHIRAYIAWMDDGWPQCLDCSTKPHGMECTHAFDSLIEACALEMASVLALPGWE